MSDSESTKTYHVRIESSRANTYGLGEEIIPGVNLFKAGHYGLTKDALDRAIKATGKQGKSHGN